MGLDMYLNKRIYIGAEYEHRKIAGIIDLTQGDNPAKPIKINFDKVSEIIERVCYWRKANQIHNWFIEHCADGDSGRRTMDVSKDQLKELVQLCRQVLEGSKLVKGKIINGQTGTKDGWVDNYEDGEYIENPELAKELLPSISGFFFGSTEYDQYYIEDLKHTIEMLEEELNNNDDNDYEYHASW